MTFWHIEAAAAPAIAEPLLRHCAQHGECPREGKAIVGDPITFGTEPSHIHSARKATHPSSRSAARRRYEQSLAGIRLVHGDADRWVPDEHSLATGFLEEAGSGSAAIGGQQCRPIRDDVALAPLTERVLHARIPFGCGDQGDRLGPRSKVRECAHQRLAGATEPLA